MRQEPVAESRDGTGRPAVVAARDDEPPVETAEMEALASAAGYDVRDVCTQVRAEDPGTHFGSGKLDDLADRVADAGAGTLLVDAHLTPAQSVAITGRLPPETQVFDRQRLVLEIFESGVGSTRARLQVELARLRYDLPRIRESGNVQALNRETEAGTPYYDVRDRIDRLESKLDGAPDPAEQFRERRREEGFDLVTLAGYTNAGKSTLLYRLADDLALADLEAAHPDESVAASVADRLFETLETTTRRATLGGRPALVTDTVGYVADLPHDLVASFSATLSEAAAADAVVLLADASAPVETLERRLSVSLDVLDEQGVDRADVVTALNKVDLLADEERVARLDVAADLAPSTVPVSAVTGTNVDEVVDAILDRLPTEQAAVTMPNGDAAMAVVSWAHDNLAVEGVDYDADAATVRARGRPGVVEQLHAKADEAT